MIDNDNYPDKEGLVDKAKDAMHKIAEKIGLASDNEQRYQQKSETERFDNEKRVDRLGAGEDPGVGNDASRRNHPDEK